MADKKPDHAATCARLWRGGERGNAIALAKAKKIKDDDLPDGLKDHAKAIGIRM